MMPAPMGVPPVEKTAKPMIAGVMYILALLIGIWQFTGWLAAYQLINASGGLIDPAGLGMMGFLSGIITILLVMGIIGIVGCAMAAAFCFMRKKWALALIGGILAFVGLHLLFGLIGFILLAISKKEFAA